MLRDVFSLIPVPKNKLKNFQLNQRAAEKLPLSNKPSTKASTPPPPK
jgi:hypothetical protein